MRAHFQLALALTAAAAFSPAWAAKYMSADEIKAVIAGNTSYGKNPKTGETSVGYHAADGKLHRKDQAGVVEIGTWHVTEDGQICSKVPLSEPERCTFLKDNKDGTYGKHKKPNNVMAGDIHVFTWTKVTPGNPEGL